MSTSLLHSRLLRAMIAFGAASLLFAAPVSAHGDEVPVDDQAGELTDEQVNELIFGDCQSRPPAFAAPLALRILPGTPQSSEVTELRVESANLPITAIEIPYPGWESAVTADGATARYVGDLPQSAPPYRFWFWLGLDKADASGGEFTAVVTMTLSDGHTVSHVLEDASASEVSREDVRLPVVRVPYTPVMVRSPEQITGPAGSGATSEPCLIGASDPVETVTSSDEQSAALPLLIGGGIVLLVSGVGAGFLLGRRR